MQTGTATMIIGLMAGLITALSAADQNIIECDFTRPVDCREWTAWTLRSKVTIAPIAAAADHRPALRFTVSEPDWNTPIITLTPFTVTNRTILEFRVKGDADGSFEINLDNATENTEYSLFFPLKKNQWTTVRKYLKDADYKRGNGGVTRDNLIGAKLRRIQIAYSGRELVLDKFKIYESEQAVTELPVEKREYLNSYVKEFSLKDYPQLRRNGIYPFGAISTVKAGDEENAILFGQTREERIENDLLDMKRHGLNTVANFCDRLSGIGERLQLMEKYHLYLAETASNGNLSKLPQNSPLLQEIAQNNGHPRLLCWYGEDEPKDFERYIINKKLLEHLAPATPVSSAFCTKTAVKNLAPVMNVLMLDLYSLTPEATNPAAQLQEHGLAVANARERCAGKRVWFISQTFSMRTNHVTSMRMPTPAEASFDLFNTLANGAGGHIFFIYNDTVPWLDNRVRREEFDRTLVDAWGNADPVYEELSRIAKQLTPIMPSLLDAAPSQDVKISCQANLISGQFKNQLGTYLIFANQNLQKNVRAEINVTLTAGQTIYDLQTGLSLPGNIITAQLPPGGGAIYMAATPAAFKTIKNEIETRRTLQQYELTDVEIKVLQKAGFNTETLTKVMVQAEKALAQQKTDNAAAELAKIAPLLQKTRATQPDFERMETALTEIQKQFGQINRILTEPTVIGKIDGTEKLKKFAEDIKTASREYFQLRREWSHGNFTRAGRLPELARQLSMLQKQANTMFCNQ